MRFVRVATPLLWLSLADIAQSPIPKLPPLVPGKLDGNYLGNFFSDFAVDETRIL